MQAELKVELAEKQARAAELRKQIADGTDSLNDSVAVAKAALHSAKLSQLHNDRRYIAEMKRGEKGYDDRGRPLPGREVNLRKNPNGPAARKAGDMLKDLKL